MEENLHGKSYSAGMEKNDRTFLLNIIRVPETPLPGMFKTWSQFLHIYTYGCISVHFLVVHCIISVTAYYETVIFYTSFSSMYRMINEDCWIISKRIGCILCEVRGKRRQAMNNFHYSRQWIVTPSRGSTINKFQHQITIYLETHFPLKIFQVNVIQNRCFHIGQVIL